MSQATTSYPMLFGEPEVTAVGGLRWLSPALIGLTLPMIAGLMLMPGAIVHARGALVIVLTMLMLLCIGAYGLSVLNPGPVTGLLIDRSTRQIELISEGTFASRVRTLSFDDVVDVRLAKRYDDDGYAQDVSELRLHDGETVALPATITAADIAVARKALGFAQAAAPTRRR
jgi:hypothetical protein